MHIEKKSEKTNSMKNKKQFKILHVMAKSIKFIFYPHMLWP